jgi:hypothetical protein
MKVELVYLQISFTGRFVEFCNEPVGEATPFNISHIDDVLWKWQIELNKCCVSDTKLNTTLFALGHLIIGNTENNLRSAVYKLIEIFKT